MENKSNKPKKPTVKKSKEEIKKEMEMRNTNEYFVKTAERRVKIAVNALKKLGYVAKYPHSEEQKNKIMERIGKSLNEMTIKFDGKTENKDEEFKL